MLYAFPSQTQQRPGILPSSSQDSQDTRHSNLSVAHINEQPLVIDIEDVAGHAMDWAPSYNDSLEMSFQHRQLLPHDTQVLLQLSAWASGRVRVPRWAEGGRNTKTLAPA